MSLEEEKLFDDLNGRFQARLRSHRTAYLKSQIRGSEVTFQSSTATLEAKFDLEVLDKLHSPSFIGIERPTAKNKKVYLIYEVVGVRAIHLQELGVEISMPKVLREEFLQAIENGWEEAKETWIDIVATPTGYLAKIENGIVSFEKTELSPLTGKKAHLLSKEAVKSFVCIEGGTEIGSLIGLDVTVTSKIDSMVRYHTGVFGFTGTGKSNLTSILVRKAIESIEDLKVVIFDVAGEYAVNLLDLLENGVIFTTERRIINKKDDFVRSQIVPESLEEAVGGSEKIKRILDLLHEQGRVRYLSLVETQLTEIQVKTVVDFLSSLAQSDKSSSLAARVALKEFTSFVSKYGFEEEDRLEDITLNPKVNEELRNILNKLKNNLHGMSSEAKATEVMLNQLEKQEEKVEKEIENPEWLAKWVFSEEAPRLVILYLPTLVHARQVAARFVNRLLDLKKEGVSDVNVLLVFDEAQEFVPDRARKEDFTEHSNIAIEDLLRQGRKYRAGCWLSTQRVAHLNVNALQQLHTYFASTLPRYYDRMVIADAYSLDYEVLNRVAELDTGEWLFVSYKATKRKNVPVFIKTPNNEEFVLNYIRKKAL
ncbi:MAG: ATP-binding protein [Thermoproteota archaeon]